MQQCTVHPGENIKTSYLDDKTSTKIYDNKRIHFPRQETSYNLKPNTSIQHHFRNTTSSNKRRPIPAHTWARHTRVSSRRKRAARRCYSPCVYIKGDRQAKRKKGDACLGWLERTQEERSKVGARARARPPRTCAERDALAWWLRREPAVARMSWPRFCCSRSRGSFHYGKGTHVA